VAHYSLLTDQQRARLRSDLRILVTEKNWEGCDGLQMTEEIKVTVAAEAALMLLGLDHDYFSQVLSIVVFPSEFEMLREDAYDEKEKYVAGGLAFYRGPVFLSWDQVLEEARDPSTGRNLVIHEFAHQLDFLDGLVNGVPVLRDRHQTSLWTQVMTQEFTRLRRDLYRGRETFLGDHAGSNATEFFAAVSERFFAVPHRLRHYHPKVYDVLEGYYRVDPSSWFTATPRKNVV
jgi:Mlc titration factor MtfA (ptsG expression regulator)